MLTSDTKLMEGFFDTEYFIEGYSNLKPHWRGLGKSHIYYITKKKVWRLESFYAVEKVTKSSKLSLMIQNIFSLLTLLLMTLTQMHTIRWGA